MANTTGQYISLVIELAPAPDGAWSVMINSADRTFHAPLRPVTLVVRLWQSQNGRQLRGTISRAGGAQVPFQTNTQLRDMIREWLLIDDPPNRQP